MTGKQDYWHFEEIQNAGGRQLVDENLVLLATLSTLGFLFASLFWKLYLCMYKSSKPTESRTAPSATVAINANGREWIII